MKYTTTADVEVIKISGKMKMAWVERRIQLELFHCILICNKTARKKIWRENYWDIQQEKGQGVTQQARPVLQGTQPGAHHGAVVRHCNMKSEL